MMVRSLKDTHTLDEYLPSNVSGTLPRRPDRCSGHSGGYTDASDAVWQGQETTEAVQAWGSTVRGFSSP